MEVRKSAWVAAPLIILVAALVVWIPLSSEGADDPPADPGASRAVAAGCDLGQSEVRMLHGVLDYTVFPGRPIGERSTDEVASIAYPDLRDIGALFSEEEMMGAARDAEFRDGTAELALEGATVTMRLWPDDSYSVVEYTLCA